MPILPPMDANVYRGEFATVWSRYNPIVGEASCTVNLVGTGKHKATIYVHYDIVPSSTSMEFQQQSPDGEWMTFYSSTNPLGEIIGDKGLYPNSLRVLQGGTATGVTVTFQRW